MKTAVIIPTCSRPDGLARAVASLAGQAPIIVSHDDAGRFGPAKTRNRGARKAADAEILIFMDDDCVAAPDCVELLVGAFADPGVVAAAGAVIYDGALGPNSRVVQNLNARWFMGAVCAVRAREFWAVGGWPEDFRVYEDKALALALASRGRIARVPAARVFHEACEWTPALRARHVDHLTYWPRLAARYDLWADPADPPPILWRHILLPRDFGAIAKNFWNAKGQMLIRQRLALWCYTLKRLFLTKHFDISTIF